MRSKQELEQIAVDYRAGRIFTDRDCNTVEEVTLCFMPLTLMTRAQMDGLKAQKPGLIYEYYDAAGPRSINGRPCFTSFRFLTEEEAAAVVVLTRQLAEAEAAVSSEQECA